MMIFLSGASKINYQPTLSTISYSVDLIGNEIGQWNCIVAGNSLIYKYSYLSSDSDPTHYHIDAGFSGTVTPPA
jgi:hypothetical protein